MLNYVWISLIVIGLLAGVGKDINDEVRNTYRNGVSIEATVQVSKTPTALHQIWEGEMVIPADAFNQFYGIESASSGIRQPVVMTTASSGRTSLVILIDESSPAFWKEMAKNSGNKDKLSGVIHSIKFSEDKSSAQISFLLEKVNYVKMRAITKAALDYADTAVTISLGLIGVMALWLGVMKVAEEAGLLRVLTRALTPWCLPRRTTGTLSARSGRVRRARMSMSRSRSPTTSGKAGRWSPLRANTNASSRSARSAAPARCCRWRSPSSWSSAR